MPELPEVYTIAHDLKEHIIGYVIKDVEVLDNYKVKPDFQTFHKSVINKKIVDVHRIAKNILVEIDDKSVIHFHLAMTGRILLSDDKTLERWTRVLFTLKAGNKTRYLKFIDMRKFGKVGIFIDIKATGFEKKYGPDLVLDNPTAEYLLNKLKRKNTSIKNVLLDQTIVAGLGNIYATDALFLAKVNPEKTTKELTLKETERILKASKEVLLEGIAHRGSTLHDKMYVDLFGKEGQHQDHFKIYQKKTCPVCGNKVIVKKISGRSTYYCPNCQK